MLGAQFEDTSSTASTRVALTLQDLVQGCVGVEYGDGSSFTATAAQIQIWDGEGYANFYYISNAYGTPAKTSGDNRHTGWANDSQVLAGETINAGTGFWVKNPSKAAGTLTFTLQ